jgi:hypothetical protein
MVPVSLNGTDVCHRIWAKILIHELKIELLDEASALGRSTTHSVPIMLTAPLSVWAHSGRNPYVARRLPIISTQTKDRNATQHQDGRRLLKSVT